MKKFITSILITLLTFAFIFNAYAANQRDGKRKFKKYCHKKCHTGNKGAPLITPSSYTKEQWELFFKNNMKKLKAVHKNGELDSLPLKQKHYRNIEAFLLDHALGSFEPESCDQ